MVQLMKSGRSESQSDKISPVKMEVEDPLEEEHGPLHKRYKQQSLGTGCFAVPPTFQYNPLDEPSPLGLRLRKSPSLLDLIQMKLSQASTSKVGSNSHGKRETKASAVTGDKLKASNFPASVLRIGTWEYKSRHEGDLVAKCYFAKHKLVWEVLDGGLKNKIEFQWSDIMSLKAYYPDESPGTLDVVLARQPLFFRETNPQPRKHTLWQATSDFTSGQASINRRHYLECPQGLLGKHFEKLIQCDPRLNHLSQQGEITLDSPYFDTKMSVFDDQNESNNSEADFNREGSPIFSLQNTPSLSGAQSCSSKNDQDAISMHSESYPRETPSPTSVRVGPLGVEDLKNGGIQINVPGLHSSISMSDLVSHLENRISTYPNLSSDEWHSLQILDEINRCMFSDLQHMPKDSDEKLLMSRVNSLCCLLQKDTNVYKTENYTDFGVDYKGGEDKCKGVVNDEQSSGLSRKDSVGELLLNLPRIASLPQFLFNISEDYDNQAR